MGRARYLMVLGLVLGALLAPTPFFVEGAQAAQRRPESDGFERELIIHDELMYQPGWMDEQQIQAFLDRWGAKCKPKPGGPPCLKDVLLDTEPIGKQTMTNRNPQYGPVEEVTVCEAMKGGKQEPAARLIARMSKACNVSPQFLLVTIQKESSLIQQPPRSYDSALGYGCPDGKPCDSTKAGLFKQLYSAAKQIRRYRHISWTYHAGDTRHFEGKRTYTNDAGITVAEYADKCSESVTFANQATASLYQYTPHVTSDAWLYKDKECSKHGDYSFWELHKRYFMRPNLDTNVFSDVQFSDAFSTDIWWMRDNQLTSGWNDGTYRRLEPVQRDAVVAFLYRLHKKSGKTPRPAHSKPLRFADVPAGSQFREEINWASRMGLVNGWDDGTFRPQSPVERGALTAILKRYCGKYSDTCKGAALIQKPADAFFVDVSSGSQFYQEIKWAKQRGLITGWPDGSFRPVNSVNRDAMAAIIHRLSVGP
ncbi:S-layer homology domain-containing protein [Boudabousia marimammalium]|uniref:SLH domain-containing protein n=1 Tax=Boudabousia marimammalium TaxID=156892 RepID=A0A1Q5PM26_9ACTO|nr:S-layer homology domain-containing protein [Boudabousia marimammalium]OKL48118.1 hypothetical protein BM477_06585 [Boudabousia marimammalium]